MTTDNELTPQDEMAQLKQRAKMMNISHSNNISLEALRKKVNDKIEGKDEEVNPLEDAGDKSSQQTKPANNDVALRQLMQREQMKLVRLRITNLDPKKKDLPGEIITVANEYLGTVSKYVPFGEVTDEGYHVPYCIYTFLDNRKFLSIREVRDRSTGTSRIETTWAKEFALDVLPPLTPEELAKLAAAQMAAGNT